jgi:hypothetical protein
MRNSFFFSSNFLWVVIFFFVCFCLIAGKRSEGKGNDSFVFYAVMVAKLLRQ